MANSGTWKKAEGPYWISLRPESNDQGHVTYVVADGEYEGQSFCPPGGTTLGILWPDQSSDDVRVKIHAVVSMVHVPGRFPTIVTSNLPYFEADFMGIKFDVELYKVKIDMYSIEEVLGW